MVYKGDPDLCYDCHQQMRAKAEFPSHHPIREGKLKCTACHDTHGAEDSALKTRMLNDLCFDCHTDKQGPFIYEHPPAEEACSLCHDPHGTIANNLLKQNEPFICLQCHQMHFHTTLAGIEGEFTTLDNYGGISHRDGAKAGMLTRCTQCHTEIHGSDLPSQSISGQGKSLTR